ncbi:hypothetical protein PAHAL_2G388800 [Panicum hallii]|uniref:Uncharacterized protein n=1 Tax=Panicum hallii TaxID=206008 RepID=A0A2S3H2X8_9POAL|nr:hypothetical protein PAHAL_2G388800 [Panicum hallii]
MSRPLSVRPAPSTTDARACRRARYTCGGTHPSAPPSSISISNSSAGSGSGTAKRLGHAGTSTGADAATGRPGPSPNARLSPPCTPRRAARPPTPPAVAVRPSASTGREAAGQGLPESAAEYQTSASARSGRSSPAGAGATAPGDPPRGYPRNRSAAANGGLRALAIVGKQLATATATATRRRQIGWRRGEESRARTRPDLQVQAEGASEETGDWLRFGARRNLARIYRPRAVGGGTHRPPRGPRPELVLVCRDGLRASA